MPDRKQRVRCLVVEDSEADLKLVARELERGGFAPEIARVDTAEQMIAALRDVAWDLVICDWEMPRFSALAALAIARERAPEVPLIIVSGTIEEETAVQALKGGAADFIMKDRLARLVPAIQRELREAAHRRARREAEEKLDSERRAREAQDRYRRWLDTLLQNVPAAIVVHGPDRRILTSNPMAQELLGLSEEQLLGKTSRDPAWCFLRPDGTALPVDEYPVDQVLARGRALRGFVAGVHRPGQSAVWVLVNAQPVLGEAREIAQVIVTFVDITDRKRAEEELRISDARFRLAQAVGHVGAWEYNLQTTKFWGSDEARRIYGFHPDALDFTTEEVESRIPERDRVHQALVDLVAAGKPYDLEFEIRPKGSASPRIISSRAELKRDERGEPSMVVGVIQDITARKLAERRIVELNQELERRVSDRTAQLASAKQELEDFVYSISHDFRAPLRHLDGFVVLLAKQAGATLDQKSARYIAQIGSAAKQMGALIDDLLSFSRIGRSELSIGTIELDELVREAIREVEPQAQGRSVEWRLERLPAVQGDRGMLRLVLTSLLTNALKFTRPRAQAVVEVGPGPASEDEVTVCVRDNGVGFDPAYVDKLFGVFQRLHRAEEFEGTGIGLANVRRIVHRHGGRTWAEGELGRGAAFFFSLPRH